MSFIGTVLARSIAFNMSIREDNLFQNQLYYVNAMFMPRLRKSLTNTQLDLAISFTKQLHLRITNLRNESSKTDSITDEGSNDFICTHFKNCVILILIF